MLRDVARHAESHNVSHAYKMVRIKERRDEIANAYHRYAPRDDGDNDFDVRTPANARQG